MLINKTVLFASEAAAVLGYSTHTIYQLIHQGKLPAFREEGHKAWRIPESSIKAYVDACLKQNASKEKS